MVTVQVTTRSIAPAGPRWPRQHSRPRAAKVPRILARNRTARIPACRPRDLPARPPATAGPLTPGRASPATCPARKPDPRSHARTLDRRSGAAQTAAQAGEELRQLGAVARHHGRDIRHAAVAARPHRDDPP